ncbi:predicted protein [Sclerotinia sclerotiorum 1980 UF-70]|uniref:Uncharacterized protein n=1 Tax=Sclerotinia sclerotiorum (strain ATCC 18683 / 1980 / Ss-1) TaxID=665079 RepID=A7EHG8_SCLS1|nr:predicted protein [Sclerotinia sclerotiorum 1980 UF-70]EDO02284.1 predicted protein [Sclerotinia sclerotiorum 1980 UF-70]
MPPIPKHHLVERFVRCGNHTARSLCSTLELLPFSTFQFRHTVIRIALDEDED